MTLVKAMSLDLIWKLRSLFMIVAIFSYKQLFRLHYIPCCEPQPPSKALVEFVHADEGVRSADNNHDALMIHVDDDTNDL